MKKIMNRILVLLIVLFIQVSFGQEITITGIVSDSSGPLPGVTIQMNGTDKGVETNFDGEYSIKANLGDVLVFSYLGMETVKRTVGSVNKINIQMAESKNNVLNEVVVTAQGISKKKRAIGFSVSTVDNSDIQGKPQTDIARSLIGKVSGVEITGDGGFLGEATYIMIRSKGSINGDDAPLIVIDGVPVNSATFNQLSPESVESTTVLKGLSASIKYGEDGRNGVIIVKTKAGSNRSTNGEFEMSLSNTTQLYEVSNLPEFQNKYGQGGSNTMNTAYVGSWGSKFTATSMQEHPYAGKTDLFPQFTGKNVRYQAVENNVSDFFKTGMGQTVNVGVNTSGEKLAFGANMSHTDQNGFVKNNSLKRLNFSVGGRYKMSNKLSISSKMRFGKTNSERPTFRMFDILLYLPRSLDIHNLPYINPATGGSVYYRDDLTNPLWEIDNSGKKNSSRNMSFSTSVTYDFSDTFNLMYRYGSDNSNYFYDYHKNKGSYNSTGIGEYRTRFGMSNVANHSLIASLKDTKLTDDIGFSSQFGFEAKASTSNYGGLSSTGQIVFGFLNHSNFKTTNPSTDYSSRKNVVGLWGDLSFDYKNYLYLSLQARNDWSSSLEKENRSMFYPSVSLSFIPTSSFPGIKSDYLSYLKLRVNSASSARYPNPYNTRDVASVDSQAFVDVNGDIITSIGIPSNRANPNLRAELLTEYELGIETRLFKNRVSFEGSIYKRVSTDQIISTYLPSSTGYSSEYINLGRIDTDGIELDLDVTPIRTDNFNWTISSNFTKYETIVKNIPKKELRFGSYNYAIANKPLNIFKGSYFARDEEGNILINAENGKVISSDDIGLEDKILGNPAPDFRIGTTSRFRYKGFGLSFQLDYKHGGDMLSFTAKKLLMRGVTRDTEDRETSYITKGVLADPNNGALILDDNGNKIQNNIQLAPYDLYFDNHQDVDEGIVYDSTMLKLRDITFSYSFSRKDLEKTPLGSLSFSATARNIWWYTPNLPKYLNIDPENAGYGTGVDGGGSPSTRQFGLSMKLTF